MFVNIFIYVFLHHLNRFGPDNFQEAMKISNRVDPTQIDWTKFKYMVFDIPNQRDNTYESRYAGLGIIHYFFLYIHLFFTIAAFSFYFVFYIYFFTFIPFNIFFKFRSQVG